jgi:hypothetical protein
MRATEIIRDLLDIIEKIDGEPREEIAVVQPATANITTAIGPDQNRFRQIVDLLSQQHQMYANSPAEVVASVDSVTVHAGGGLNGPKNPADMRADSFSMYPNYQAENKGQQ